MRISTPYNVTTKGNMLKLEEYRSHSQSKEHSTTHLVLNKPSEYDQAGGHRLRRFYFRALVGVLGPFIVCGYFIAVWRIYLAPIDPKSPVPFGLPGATWIFYSWFVAGVIGLNLSLYGLAGVEAALLMESTWNVGDAMRLMMHADNTWSGPGGWLKTIKWVIQFRKGDKHGRFPSRLWFILALPSMIVFTAWPLSGLTMEVTQGYLRGKQSANGALVKGFSYANFNERKRDEVWNGALLTWKNSLDSNIPGQGIVYTPEGIDRSQYPFLNKLPSVLPTNDGVSRVFLTAQAEHPIEGNNWGLLLQYNCSVVEHVEDLTILKHRNSTLHANGILHSSGQISYTLEDETKYVFVRNQTNGGSGWVENLYAVMEVGYQMWPNKTAIERISDGDPFSAITKTTSCYFNEAENVTGDYPGIDQEQVFEILLWQSLQNISRGPEGTNPNYNYTIDHNITELYGAYDLTDFYLQSFPGISKNETQEFTRHPMSAIGVQCKLRSNVGTANINDRIEANTPVSLLPEDSGQEWLSLFFTSTAAPPPFYAANVDDETDMDAGYGYTVQLNYLQAEQLRSSLLRAYGAYATQLMYNGGQGFTAVDGSHIDFMNPNVTEFVPGTVLKLGVMPAIVPVALFCVWALIGSILGIVYGFRRRWSAILDGYTMFRLGADLADDSKRMLGQYSNTLEVEECLGLTQVPGLIGDKKPDLYLGRIGLVHESVADKTKLYE